MQIRREIDEMVWTDVASAPKSFVEVPNCKLKFLGGGQMAISWVEHRYLLDGLGNSSRERFSRALVYGKNSSECTAKIEFRKLNWKLVM